MRMHRRSLGALTAALLVQAKFENSSFIFIVETQTGFLIADSDQDPQLSEPPVPPCTSSCVDNCCRITALQANDPRVRDAGVRSAMPWPCARWVRGRS